MPSTIADSWRVIRDTLREHCPQLFDALAKPASNEQIAGLEKTIGQSLPSDLIESLKIHNGMNDSYLNVNRLFNYEALLSTDTIASQWQMMSELERDGFFENGDCLLSKASEIKNDSHWNPLWIPITDADGSGYCIDLDPAAGGVEGQIFYFYCNGARPREVAAKSYSVWLAGVAHIMASGEFESENGAIWLE